MRFIEWWHCWWPWISPIIQNPTLPERLNLESSNIVYTGWRRINRAIQPFNLVYENLHKITPSTLVAHRQIGRQRKCAFKYSEVINILCDAFSTGWCASSSFTTNSCIFASSCARISGTRKLVAEEPRHKPSGLSDLGEHVTACLLSSLRLRHWAPERSPANLLGEDRSRRYRSHYGTVSQTIVARCCNRYRTHWAALWLVFLVLHVDYHTYVFCCRNTELGQQK